MQLYKYFSNPFLIKRCLDSSLIKKDTILELNEKIIDIQFIKNEIINSLKENETNIKIAHKNYLSKEIIKSDKNEIKSKEDNLITKKNEIKNEMENVKNSLLTVEKRKNRKENVKAKNKIKLEKKSNKDQEENSLLGKDYYIPKEPKVCEKRGKIKNKKNIIFIPKEHQDKQENNEEMKNNYENIKPDSLDINNNNEDQYVLHEDETKNINVEEFNFGESEKEEESKQESNLYNPFFAKNFNNIIFPLDFHEEELAQSEINKNPEKFKKILKFWGKADDDNKNENNSLNMESRHNILMEHQNAEMNESTIQMNNSFLLNNDFNYSNEHFELESLENSFKNSVSKTNFYYEENPFKMFDPSKFHIKNE